MNMTRRQALTMPVLVALSPMGCDPHVEAGDTDTHEYGPGLGFARQHTFHLDDGSQVDMVRDYGPGALFTFTLRHHDGTASEFVMPLAEAKAFAEIMLHLIHQRADER